MDESKVKANDVWLPETSVDPYFQYGVGVQKRWGERFNGFFQTMIRNGGRTGIAFSAGFRWAIGNKPSEKNIKSSTPELPKTKVNLKSAKYGDKKTSFIIDLIIFVCV